jgi:hypothetical protein
MKIKLNLFLVILISGINLAYAQSNHTISINGLNDGWASVETFTNISPSGNAYFTWDADYIYFGISHSEADWGNLATFMYFDTDPFGSNGSNNAYAWGQYITTPFNADYVVVWKNLSGADYIEVRQWNGSAWNQIGFSTSTSLIVGGNTVVEFAIGTDYREVRVKRSYIGNPDAIKFCTFTEQQWGSYWRYFAWPNNGWTDAGRTSGQSIPNYYGFILVAGISQTNSPYYNASFNGYTGSGTDWATGSNWTKGSAPTNSDLTIIPTGKNVEISTSTQANSYDLLIQGSLTIKSSNSGTGSLITSNVISGQITSERYIAGYTSPTNGWHLISSPVNNFAISSTSIEPGTNDDLYLYDETSNYWLNYKVNGNFTSMTNGKGYLCAYETSATKSFTGTANNQNITFTDLSLTDSRGWHTLGNPFQSAIKWNDGNWSITNINTNAWVLNPGGTYTVINTNGILPANQGFFIRVTNSSNSITIPKAARTHDNTTWYKSTNGSDRLTFIAKSTYDNTYVEAGFVLNEEATEGIDETLDATFLSGIEGTPKMYLLNGIEKQALNAVPAFNGSYDLGFEPGNANEYSMEISGLELLPEGTHLFLTDMVTAQTYDLNERHQFTFTSKPGDPINRFKLSFSSLGLNENKTNPHHIFVQENTLFISPIYKNTKVELIALDGRTVLSVNTSTGKIDLTGLKGIFIVRVNSDSGVSIEKIVTK